MPELRWKPCAPPDSPRVEAREKSAVGGARPAGDAVRLETGRQVAAPLPGGFGPAFRVGFAQRPAKAFAVFMPTEPAQIALALFELCLFAGGVALLGWVLGSPVGRARWLRTNE